MIDAVAEAPGVKERVSSVERKEEAIRGARLESTGGFGFVERANTPSGLTSAASAAVTVVASSAVGMCEEAAGVVARDDAPDHGAARIPRVARAWSSRAPAAI